MAVRPVKTRLLELCRELGKLGLWVRLHYVYPYPSVDDLIPLMADGKNPALPRRALPARQPAHPQADEAARRRRRRCSIASSPWRREVPDLAIRSTFITGFPGETEAEFNELLDFLDEAQLDRVGAFSYSPVAGASANELPGALPEEVREERKARLLRHQEDISTQRLERDDRPSHQGAGRRHRRGGRHRPLARAMRRMSMAWCTSPMATIWRSANLPR
jgi:ribosomal protein S12 methylthiotransferase